MNNKNIVVITGGSRGIGASVVEVLASKGYNVCITYHSNIEKARELASKIESLYDISTMVVKVDLRNESDITNLFNYIYEESYEIVALVNNAGISGSRVPLSEMNIEELRSVIDVNCIGNFLCAREAIKKMAFSYGGKGGVIVNISSLAAITGGYHLSHYSASKSAMISLTTSLSNEVASEGIRVNCVSPGIINTDQNKNIDNSKIQKIPLKRFGESIEVARVICWLISDESSYVTGANIPVTGGL